MAEREEGETEELLSPWEQTAAQTLRSQELPRWDHKAKTARFAQGHLGLLDLDLDFPSAYLKEPARVCYVWTGSFGETQRVHAYVDIDGRCFHVVWAPESGPQLKPPAHEEGLCDAERCAPCRAAEAFRNLLEEKKA